MNKYYEVGQGVYDIMYGAGTIVKIEEASKYPISVEFSLNNSRYERYYTMSGKLLVEDTCPRLSHTIYSLETGGFSRQEIIPLNTVVYVRKAVVGEGFSNVNGITGLTRGQPGDWVTGFFAGHVDGKPSIFDYQRPSTKSRTVFDEIRLTNPLLDVIYGEI